MGTHLISGSENCNTVCFNPVIMCNVSQQPSLTVRIIVSHICFYVFVTNLKFLLTFMKSINIFYSSQNPISYVVILQCKILLESNTFMTILESNTLLNIFPYFLIWLHFVALAVLNLTIQTRLPSKSQRSTCLHPWSSGMKDYSSTSTERHIL